MPGLHTVNFIRVNGLDALSERYAIKVNRHATFTNLVHLKYSQIESPMGERICQECRALILDEADDWRAASFPFAKFWNHGEEHAATIDWATARVQEKLDGSLCVLYPYRGGWHVSTTGTPDASGDVWGHRGTFADLFWETWRSLRYPLPFPGRKACFMFELMTPYNRVVVQHKQPRLVCIGARDLYTLEEFPAERAAAEHGWECVKSYRLTTMDEVIASCAAINPIEAEGYVVVDAAFNRVKVKSPQYVALAHMKDACGPRRLFELIRKGEGSEWLAYFPQLKAEYDEVKARFDVLCEGLEADYARLKDIPDQKSFAMGAKACSCSSPLFAIRSKKCGSVREFFATCTMSALERAMGITESVA